MQHSRSQARGHRFHADECRVTTTDIVVCSFFLLVLVLALALVCGLGVGSDVGLGVGAGVGS